MHVRTPTSPEVWAVIRARHRDLQVFASFSDPEGSHNGGQEGVMETSYALPGADFPLLEAKTTWTINHETHKRIDEIHEYWLVIAQKE